MKISNNIQDTIQLLSNFKVMSSQIFSVAGRLNFPNVSESDGEAELCRAISSVEKLLHEYIDCSIADDIEKSRTADRNTADDIIRIEELQKERVLKMTSDITFVGMR